MREVEASAKEREEAIQKALNELGIEMSDVRDIEIVEEGSRGLFGLGARPWRVKVTAEGEPTPKRGRGRAERGKREDRGEKAERRPREERAEAKGETREDRRERRGGRPRGRGANGGGGSDEARQEKSEPREERGGRRGPQRGKRGPQREPRDSRRGEHRQDGGGNGGGGRSRQQQRPPREDREQETRREEEEAAFAPISDELGGEAAALLGTIIEKMGIEAKTQFRREEDGAPRIEVESEDSAILIGRKGRNLSAMQYLINRMVAQEDPNENTERLVVDVEGYVDRRRASLEDMARNLAQKALDTGRNMRLKPMSPQERRIIHLTLQDNEEVRTFSLGSSLYRSVIISPKNAKSERSSRPPRRRGGRARARNAYGHDDDVDAGQFGD